MASGGSPRGAYAVAAVVVVIVLSTTGVWNPFPKIWSWLNTSEPIAAGVSRWQTTTGGSPQSVTIANDAVIVEYRTSIEAYGLFAGLKLWGNDADWAAVAGEGSDAVVVTGRLLTKGYQVLDPRSGIVRRSDTEATAVWAYRNAILDLHCGKGSDCELTAWDPRGNARWRVSTGGIGFVLNAANPDLPDTHPLTAQNIDDDVAGPRYMPAAARTARRRQGPGDRHGHRQAGADRTAGPGPAGRGGRRPGAHGHRHLGRRDLLLRRGGHRSAGRRHGVAAGRAQPADRVQRLGLQTGPGPGRRRGRGARRRPGRAGRNCWPRTTGGCSGAAARARRCWRSTTDTR